MFTAMCIEIPQLAATSFISHNYRGPVIKSSLNKSYEKYTINAMFALSLIMKESPHHWTC